MLSDLNHICFACKTIKNKILPSVLVLHTKSISVFTGFNVPVSALAGTRSAAISVASLAIASICCCNPFFYNTTLCKSNISRKRKHSKSFHGLNYMHLFKKKKRNVWHNCKFSVFKIKNTPFYQCVVYSNWRYMGSMMCNVYYQRHV